MLAFANAKINLGLNITEKRPDNYHNLETVFYPVKIYDVLELLDAEETSCAIKGIDVPGAVSDNICLKAYRLLQEDFSLPAQQIVLLKNIPVGAGLGGGSSDAAFLIKLANDKFKLGLSVSQMEDYARKLGADCAFFIQNKPLYAFEKGDQFKELNIDLSKYYLVLVKPSVHVSTADAYALLKPALPVEGLKELIHLPLKDWKNHVKNDFEEAMFIKYPEIAIVKEQLYQAGATFALMSGSGSSVFAIFEHEVALPELEIKNRVFYNI
ncbi:4-(cytidine 5'-diphospho)-2-C-methyl-D-erythritol kinase [Pedobacter sp. MC2016-14]|uniref:4-(cytidine 5'-diphospho)-2-C-methyl-D-erythritol kinase n=1 Tax=Pedobacter sp. MC2016-14 TaxID=2897327 RepID=UPI001E500200|nr:4-(cytidine 5'-diphospho)-2-C-methyl-D-erythritol kinase [Pedobacter sp. MC2016-14]MCD0489398.1 4-(cytidine 5'-diphospho)-2-C-methyl-D-erythritol kinase [Pedobacter sp. MC2016-14]